MRLYSLKLEIIDIVVDLIRIGVDLQYQKKKVEKDKMYSIVKKYVKKIENLIKEGNHNE